jgi:acyl carrier protein
MAFDLPYCRSTQNNAKAFKISNKEGTMLDTAVVTEDEIVEKLKEITATVVMKSAEQISEDASLIDDLGMESIDFYDITFKLEEMFGIEMPRKPVFERMMDHFGQEELSINGRLTAKGATVLKLSFPDIPPAKMFNGLRLEEVPALVTLKAYVHVIQRALALAAWQPKTCSTCGAEEFIPIDKAKIELSDEEAPIGPVYQCVRCDNIQTAPSFDQPLIEKIEAVF